jgi:hypothetical protein
MLEPENVSTWKMADIVDDAVDGCVQCGGRERGRSWFFLLRELIDFTPCQQGYTQGVGRNKNEMELEMWEMAMKPTGTTKVGCPCRSGSEVNDPRPTRHRHKHLTTPSKTSRCLNSRYIKEKGEIL